MGCTAVEVGDTPMILYVLVAVVLANLAVYWCDSHDLTFKHVGTLGRFEVTFGIEGVGERDFDLTLQCDPLWYFTLQVSTWCLYFNCVWSRDPLAWADCSHQKEEGVE